MTYQVVDDKKVLKAIRELTSHEKWALMTRIDQSLNWHEEKGYNEHTTSAALAWLLDPAQGHGLGDRFIKRLLLEVRKEEDEAANAPKNRDYYFGYLDIYNMSFGAAVVATEAEALGENRVGRVDVLVVDPVNEVVLIIERKTGTGTHSDQLNRYHQWACERFPGKDWERFFVVSGKPGSGDETDQDRENWHFVEDDWLLKELDAVLSEGRVSEEIAHHLAHLKHYVFSEDWESLPFYSDVEEASEELAEACLEPLKVLSDARIKTDNGMEPLMKQSYQGLLVDWIPKADDATRRILQFYIRHSVSLWWLKR